DCAGRRRRDVCAGAPGSPGCGLPRHRAARLGERPGPGRPRAVAESERQPVGARRLDGDDLRRPVLGHDSDGYRARAATSRPRLRVAVLAGGRTSGHELSLASARWVVAALDPERYDVAEIGIGRNGRWELGTGATTAETLPVPYDGGPLERLGAVDVVLPVLHGPVREDGAGEGIPRLAGTPSLRAALGAPPPRHDQ